MKRNRIAAIMIAAGYSSRMNEFKPLLPFDDCTAIERLINTYQRSGIQDIYVVVGYNSQAVMEQLKGAEVTFVWNEAYADGMFSSIKKGILALEKDIHAFFLQPVDIPLIKEKTLDFLKDMYYICNKGILYPTFAGKRGHPPLIDCKYNSLIVHCNEDGGLRRILEKQKEDSVCVPVLDKAVLMDMDRRTDYQTLLAYDRLHSPDKEECMEILKYYKVPEPIVKHGEAVANAACILCNELNAYGLHLDRHALFAAALLHDMARMEKNHAAAGAKILKEMGYDFVASIINTHMDINSFYGEPITENEVLYLADKMVLEDRRCNIDERFKWALHNKGDCPQAVQNIKRRWLSARTIIMKRKRITGKGFVYDKTYIPDSSWND